MNRLLLPEPKDHTARRLVTFGPWDYHLVQGYGRWRKDLGKVYFNNNKDPDDKPFVYRPHPHVRVKYRSEYVEIDEKMWPIIRWMWSRNIRTRGCCQGEPNATHESELAYIATTYRGARILSAALTSVDVPHKRSTLYPKSIDFRSATNDRWSFINFAHGQIRNIVSRLDMTSARWKEYGSK